MYAASIATMERNPLVQIGPMSGADDVFMAIDCGEVSVVRLRFEPGQTLFEAGERAVSCYVLMRGSVAIAFGDRAAPCGASLSKPGTLFFFACGDTHVARCQSTDTCEVLRIERGCLERLRQLRPALRTLLQSVHAGELSLILSALRHAELATSSRAEAAVAMEETRGATRNYAVGDRASRWASAAVASWRRRGLNSREAYALT